MAKKMLIDATHPEETRVVVVDGQKVEDFDFESITKRQLAGNIYLAKVTRVEPSLQAAFIEYGGNRHGFLAFTEIHPDYYQIPVADREALLEEERREEEARKAREEHGDDDPKPKRSRGRRKKAVADPETATDAAEADTGGETKEVAGLEVIDLGADAASEPVGESTDLVADDAPAVGEKPAPETDEVTAQTAGEAATAEADQEPRAADPVAEPAGDAPEPVSETVETTADDTPADAAEGTSETPPRSMAESAGLDDEDRVTGEVDTADRARKTDPEDTGPQETGPEGSSDAQPETSPAAEDAPAASSARKNKAEPEVAAEPVVSGDVETSSGQPDPVAAENAEAVAETATDADNSSGEESTDEEAKSGKSGRRGRRRRSKSRRPDEEEASAPEETEDAAVESVGAEDTLEEAARARSRLRRKYKIQDVIRVRQILLVQVVKEERGNKGAALTTYLSLAGRYCVLMPNTARGGGISRKITNAPDRKRLREVISEMEVPQGMGLIVRTAGAERTRAEIKRDYEFLIRQWEQIRELTLKSIAPTLIYEEGSLIKRSIRDIYSKEIDQILVEGDGGYREAKEYMKMLMPSHAKNVQPYAEQTPLFSRYQVESYLNGMFNPTCQLKSGGYIVIGVTEALVAIDVNSGRATKQGSIEETALQTNLEAADEVARQLRLRDLAGLIVIDFIDMDENRNNRSVEKRMKDRLKNDRARIQVGRISAFGLMEMSRQRLRPGMIEATTQPCPHCMGTGLVRSDENMSLSILREVEEEALRGRSDEITIRAPFDVANYLINNKRPHIAQLEARHGIQVIVLADPSLISPNYQIERAKSATPRPKPQSDVIRASASSDDVEEAEVIETADRPASDRPDGDDEEGRARRRRGKRGGRRRRGEGESEAEEDQSAETQVEAEDGSEASEDGDGDGKRGKGRRSRGRRRGGRGRRDTADDNAAETYETSGGDDQAAEAVAGEPTADTVITADAASPAETVASADVTEPEVPAAEAPAEAAELVETTSARQPAEAPPEVEVPAEPTAGTEAVASEPVEPVAEPEPEPEPTAEPESPPKPKRRGWWSFGS